jgi:hypothetical protein
MQNGSASCITFNDRVFFQLFSYLTNNTKKNVVYNTLNPSIKLNAFNSMDIIMFTYSVDIFLLFLIQPLF